MTRNTMRALAVAFVAIAGLGSFAATAQQATAGANTSLETIEVIAQREKLRLAIQSFVANVTRSDGDNVARWRFPICPSVTGIADEHAAFIGARIVAVAQSVGAPTDRNQAGCTPNLYVIVTPQPDALWANLKRRYPGLFSQLQPPRVRRSLSTRPVQAIQNVVLNNADGVMPATTGSYKLKDSHLRSSVTEDFTSAVIVVNDAETGAATFGQLADYLALVALARVDLSADFAGTDSILALFAMRDTGTPAPASLTAWDRSFLRTLYGADIAVLRPRRLISSTMFQGLVPEGARP